MKYILLVLVLVFPAFVSAQTPNLYDKWAPTLAGTMLHITVEKDQVIFSHSLFGAESGLQGLITLPPQQEASSEAVEKPAAKTQEMRSDTIKLLKVVFDSAKAKGRMFISEGKYTKNILVFQFLLKDNGEMEIRFYEPFVKGRSTSVKDAEKRSKTLVTKPNQYDYRISFYNPAAVAAFEKLKDPSTATSEELYGMIKSYGDRMSASFQGIEPDTARHSSSGYGYGGMFYSNALHIVHDLFVTHGYNPLALARLTEKIKGDTIFRDAGKEVMDRIQESVPSMREQKAKLEVAQEDALKHAIVDMNKNFAAHNEKIALFLDQSKVTLASASETLARLRTAYEKGKDIIVDDKLLMDPAAFKNFENIHKEIAVTILELDSIVRNNSELYANLELVNQVYDLERNDGMYQMDISSYNYGARKMNQSKLKNAGASKYQYFDYTMMPAPAPPPPAPIPTSAPPSTPHHVTPMRLNAAPAKKGE